MGRDKRADRQALSVCLAVSPQQQTINLITGRIQINGLTTLSNKFQVFYEKIESLNHTIGKDIIFVFFRKFVTTLIQKFKKKGK